MQQIVFQNNMGLLIKYYQRKIMNIFMQKLRCWDFNQELQNIYKQFPVHMTMFLSISTFDVHAWCRCVPCAPNGVTCYGGSNVAALIWLRFNISQVDFTKYLSVEWDL